VEGDACGIYEDRPFVCREYLVTLPVELCRDPFVNPVQVVPMPIAAAGGMLRTVATFLGSPQFTVPLVLALEYAAAHRAELEQTFPSRDVFSRAAREGSGRRKSQPLKVDVKPHTRRAGRAACQCQ
jgi:hypothetical protein